MTEAVSRGRLDWIRETLAAGGIVGDRAFDLVYPDDVRRRSSMFWTPVWIATHAAAWLAPEPGARVLDVGAGCGKLCCVGALVASGASWCGVERDAGLVATASRAAAALGVERQTTFTLGDALALDWTGFDSLYLYNPFEAGLFHGKEPGDEWCTYCREVEAVEQILAEMPAGSRVVTYYGFGGEMPDTYQRVQDRSVIEASLALWIKRPARKRERSSWISARRSARGRRGRRG